MPLFDGVVILNKINYYLNIIVTLLFKSFVSVFRIAIMNLIPSL